MTSQQASEAAAQANKRRYNDGEVVSQYVLEPYHTLRLSLAADLVAHYACFSSASTRIADLAAGGPHFARLIGRTGLSVVCCDNSSNAVAEGAQLGLPGLLLDVQSQLPFLSGSLDAIYAGEILEHLFDPGAFLSECRRSLKTGGILVLTTPNLATAQDRLRFLIGRSPRQVNPYHDYLKLHIRPFTASSLRGALLKEGFTPLALRSNYVRWYTHGKYRQSRLLARLCPSLGGTLIVAGRST
jgi:SAM-dependent methyltransferase